MPAAMIHVDADVAPAKPRRKRTTGAPAEWSSRLPTMLTVKDVARVLRMTPAAVYAMVERGQLPGVVRIGRRRVRIREDALLDFLRQKSTSFAGKAASE